MNDPKVETTTNTKDDTANTTNTDVINTSSLSTVSATNTTPGLNMMQFPALRKLLDITGKGHFFQ